VRIAFMGTPELAAISLRALLASEHDVVAVVSQPDRPAGRGRKLVPTPVAAAARAASVPLQQPDSVGTPEFREWLRSSRPDVAVVAAFGRILGPKLLALPALGCINVHASLLPRWRGASPIQSAILSGDPESGVTIMQMVRALDAGDILHVVRTPISSTDTAASLHDRLAELGASALIEALGLLAGDQLTAVAQDDARVTYAPRIAKPEGDIDWTRPAVQLDRQIRGLHPWPGTRCTLLGRGLQLKLHPPVAALPSTTIAPPGTIIEAGTSGVDVACGDGSMLRLLTLQAPGKRPLNVAPFLSGFPLSPGEVLG
jgi:methionyl-tRNA formyltransferase